MVKFKCVGQWGCGKGGGGYRYFHVLQTAAVVPGRYSVLGKAKIHARYRYQVPLVFYVWCALRQRLLFGRLSSTCSLTRVTFRL